MEGKALRLRLSIQENQVLEYQKHIQSMENEAQRQEAFSLGTPITSTLLQPPFLSLSCFPSHSLSPCFPHSLPLCLSINRNPSLSLFPLFLSLCISVYPIPIPYPSLRHFHTYTTYTTHMHIHIHVISHSYLRCFLLLS